MPHPFTNVRVVAHRGLHRPVGLPENSAAAFDAAWAVGVPWCECDVHSTRDHRVVVLHDDTLDRTTTGRGRVDRQGWDDLKHARLLDADDGAPTDHGLPLLTDVLHAMPAGCGMLVELKPPMPMFHHVARAMIARGWRVEIQSFDPDNLRGLCEHGLGRQGVLLVDDVRQVRQAIEMTCAGVHLRHDLVTPDLVDALQRAGLAVGAWTVNDPADVRRLAAAGVTTIITDDPLAVAGALSAD
jgi:glycerophosphoryl diester phosphodiesterase